jgi:hypothetical protein
LDDNKDTDEPIIVQHAKKFVSSSSSEHGQNIVPLTLQYKYHMHLAYLGMTDF